MIGFIKLHRQLLTSPSFRTEQERMAFAWLLLHANWQDGTVRYKGFQIDLKRGQLALSYRDFSAKWGWSEPKCRRYLTRLSSDAVVSTASDAGVNVITILKYNDFQDSSKQSDAPSDAPALVKATQDRRRTDAQKEEGNNIITNNSIKKDAGKTTHSLPNNWVPSTELRAAILKKGYEPWQIDNSVETFREYWTEGKGSGTKRKGWDASFRSWVYKMKPRQDPQDDSISDEQWMKRLKYMRGNGGWNEEAGKLTDAPKNIQKEWENMQ